MRLKLSVGSYRLVGKGDFVIGVREKVERRARSEEESGQKGQG